MKYSDEQIFEVLESYFAQQGVGREGAAALTPDTDIVGQGLIDSLGIFKLIAYVEEKFAVTVQPEDVLLENFQSLRALRNLIVKKLVAVGQTQSAP